MEITTLDLGFEIYDLNTCFPHVVPCHTGGSMTSLSISRNLLLLVVAKKTMDAYLRLFAQILEKDSITALTITMVGKLPALVGALGSAMRGRAQRTYDWLAIRLGGVFTHESGLSPYWEAFGYPVVHIINFGLPSAEQGYFIMSAPREYWAVPTRIETLLERTGEEQQSGELQIEFGEKPDSILTLQRGVCTGLAWDPDQERYHPMGVIERFEYVPDRMMPTDVEGVVRARTDGTAHGSLVAFVRPQEDEEESHRWQLEEDPTTIGAGGIPEEDQIRRAALGSRFLDLLRRETGAADDELDRSLRTLSPPRGLTIEDQNLFSDKEDLVSLLESSVIRAAGFDHLELTLIQDVSVTIPDILEGVITVCNRLRTIQVLLIKLPRSPSRPCTPGLGCHILNLLWDFGNNRFPARLDIVPEDYDKTQYESSGSDHSHFDRRVEGSGRWDPYHHHLGLPSYAPRRENVMSLTLSRLQLTDADVSQLPDTLPNLHTLSVAQNGLTDEGVLGLLVWAPNLVILDLEDNEIVLAPHTDAAAQLWKAHSTLRHLNISHNRLTIESIVWLYWEVGRSSLTTFDASMSEYPGRHVPARLLTFLLLNESLERADLRGVRFCSMVMVNGAGLPPDPELYPGGVIDRSFAEHPRLRSILLDKNMFWPSNSVASVWPRLFHHVLMGLSLNDPTPALHSDLVMPHREDLEEWDRWMAICTGNPGGVIRLVRDATPVGPNFTLWHLSRPEVGLDPTSYVEPSLHLNRTRNPILARWRDEFKDETDWVEAMSTSLATNFLRLRLIPHILASFEKMSMESHYSPSRTPYNIHPIPFSTGECMYPPRTFRYGEHWSLTYVALKEFMMSDLSGGLP